MRLVVKVSLLTSDSLLWYKTKLPRSLSFSLPAIYWLGKSQNFSRLSLSYQTFPHQLWNKSWGQISPSPCWSDDGQEPRLLAQRVETHCAAAPPQDRKRHSRRRTKRARQDAEARDHRCCIFGNQSQDTWFRGKEELWMSQSGFKADSTTFIIFLKNMDHFSSLYWFSYNIVLPCFVLVFRPQGMWVLSFPSRDQTHIPLHWNMLSCFSSVWLFVILWAVALQAPLSMGFSRHEYWSG